MKKTIVMAAMAACMFVSNVFAQKIKGSDTCLPLSQTEAENFINKNKSAKITVTGGGSGVGISALMEGTTDIAMITPDSLFIAGRDNDPATPRNFYVTAKIYKSFYKGNDIL